MIKLTRLALILTLFWANTLYAPTDQIVQNTGFENGTSYPTDQNQLGYLCDFWEGLASITPDWYITEDLRGALRGPCPFESGSAEEIFAALPKLTTYDGSTHFAGFGSTEYVRNELSRSTYPDSKVKVSFHYTPRGEIRDVTIGVILVDLDNTTNNLRLVDFEIITSGPSPTHVPCQWYYFESPWLDSGPPEFEQLQVGGLSPPNPSGAYNEPGYTYIDDVRLYNGIDCCEPFKLYENTDNLPPLTHVSDYIIAGHDAGIPNTSGDVIVQAGQNVTSKAGNRIELRDGFKTEFGSTFHAVIEPCDPFTKPAGEPITIITFPNVITPNGDGVNDNLCLRVNGATAYSVIVKNRFGITVFEDSGSVSSNIPCVWDGTCNKGLPNCSGSSLNDGSYDVFIHFSNCDRELDAFQVVELLNG